MIKRSYSLMDRMADSGSAGLGSIPGGTTFYTSTKQSYFRKERLISSCVLFGNVVIYFSLFPF